MISFLRDGLLVRRAGNLVFVCGGNDPNEHLRPHFCEFLKNNAKEFNVFQPEFAMKNYFSDENGGQLDLGDFEELIGELSHAIVIFPEAPGSFAETGYFCKTKALAEKSILVLDNDRQADNSFILMGPARKFNTDSKFSPNAQISYENPDFESIVKKIRWFDLPKTRKALDFDNLTSYDIFCLVYQIFDILLVSTYDDIVMVFNSLTSGHAPRRRIKDIASILVGAGFVRPVGEFGHYACLPLGAGLTEFRDGFVQQEFEIKLEINTILEKDSSEFAALVRERASAN